MSGPDRPAAVVTFAVARGALGAALLDPDGPLLRTLARRPLDGRERAFARALGARHLLQAAVTFARPTPGTLRGSAAVDALHGTSTLWLVARSDDRRLASANAASAAVSVLVDLRLARRA